MIVGDDGSPEISRCPNIQNVPIFLGKTLLDPPCELGQLLRVRQVDARDAARRQLLACHVFGVVRRRVLPNDFLLMVDVLLVI